jgi:hypothetical protein
LRSDQRRESVSTKEKKVENKGKKDETNGKVMVFGGTNQRRQHVNEGLSAHQVGRLDVRGQAQVHLDVRVRIARACCQDVGDEGPHRDVLVHVSAPQSVPLAFDDLKHAI